MPLPFLFVPITHTLNKPLPRGIASAWCGLSGSEPRSYHNIGAETRAPLDPAVPASSCCCGHNGFAAGTSRDCDRLTVAAWPHGPLPSDCLTAAALLMWVLTASCHNHAQHRAMWILTTAASPIPPHLPATSAAPARPAATALGCSRLLWATLLQSCELPYHHVPGEAQPMLPDAVHHMVLAPAKWVT